METPGKSSLHGFRTHPQDYVMVFFAPDTKALCQPVIEIPVLRHKTGRVAHPDHAHAIETIEHWRQIPARHPANQIGHRPMNKSAGNNPPPLWSVVLVRHIFEFHAASRHDSLLDTIGRAHV